LTSIDRSRTSATALDGPKSAESRARHQLATHISHRASFIRRTMRRRSGAASMAALFPPPSSVAPVPPSPAAGAMDCWRSAETEWHSGRFGVCETLLRDSLHALPLSSDDASLALRSLLIRCNILLCRIRLVSFDIARFIIDHDPSEILDQLLFSQF
jgi:hypothetical protein